MRRGRSYGLLTPRGIARLSGETKGQMAVELAVLMPVVLICALTVYNLGRFAALCASFDRLAVLAVLTQGVSPAGECTDDAAVRAVETALREDMGESDGWEVCVEAQKVPGSSRASVLSLAPYLTRFTCTLRYRPWPSSFVVAGVSMRPPAVLVHTRSLTVDPYRPGVVR